MASAAQQASGKLQRLPLEQPDDVELAERLIVGEEAAHALAFDRFAPVVRGILRQNLPSCDVDDATQEVFLRLFRRVHTLNDHNALRSFVIGITIRVGLRELRRRKARRWLRLGDELPAASHPGIDPQARAALERLHQLLDQLSAEARMLFVLRFVRQLELREIASATGMSLATTKRKLRRVRTVIAARVASDPLLADYAPEAP